MGLTRRLFFVVVHLDLLQQFLNMGVGLTRRLSVVVPPMYLIQYPYQRMIRLKPNRPNFVPWLVVFLLVVASPFDAKYLVCTYHSLPQKLDAMVLLLGMIYLSYECK